ncbi:tRNA A64-2'-O-ribosylphosphate transferase [Cucurbitaria berberidis CBS 394.84]|uniref:tRNA A64-2'-O-ribosylphosphate transferase n=1 Tax=Cucurbitaria berberidis CBS 394.84 TaxID=1168544 RepID=A0A9P4GRC1_9PLEO|nr:tRNA A64-2'-O-ribosylphosphate transferase [Cucurbitaria berberidis CBS 394.84]KAF1851173.1 tRNA A64-2'-O-ribosylphosphate transferase [Cucurbitaria berberidis CBS 394.84]
MSQPLKEADIIFPHLSNTPNLSQTLSSLRRSTLSIHNRLASISTDSDFVTSVAVLHSLPLVANERCGSWYIPPSLKSESVYFKSTDGHMGEWRFSLRRLNLQLLDVVEKWGGAVIVDSTRRGKSMPDALSKTVPIWCCVVNRAIFGEKHELFTPPQAVSESEHAQIEKRIEGLVHQFLDICKPNIPNLRAKLQKPLRPIWVTQQSSLSSSPPSFPGFHSIVLCTASRRVRGAEGSENGYIQGAADDHEAWAQGLTPTLFWKNKDLLMGTSEEDAPSLIERLISEKDGSSAVMTLIKPTSQLYISSSQNVDLGGFNVVISCTPEPLSPTSLKDANVQHYLHLKCQTGKLGSRDLRSQLPRLLTFFTSFPAHPNNILVCCPTSKDLSVGTALAILCLYADDAGQLDLKKRMEAKGINKAFIKQRLSWITTSNPALNPSRATLQSVNAVLLESQDPKAALPTKHSSENTPGLPTSLPIRQTKPDAQEPETKNEHDHKDEVPKQKLPNIPAAIFRHLESTDDRPWNFTRTLRSALSTHPSGTVTGTATFTPCNLSSSTTLPLTLLYAEQGDFVTDSGLRFTARRKYVYQLKSEVDSADDEVKGKEDKGNYIAVHFFDDEKMPRSATTAEGVGEKGEGVGGLFVEMGELKPHGDVHVLHAKNREQHLCAADLYTASWQFLEAMGRGEGGELWWEVRYDAKGPKKDYYSSTRYTRSQ